MEWTNELIFDFLNLYQNEPTLWNSATPEHKNKNDSYDAWNRIKSKLKDGTISVKEIKKKRDNLMSTYRRQRSKIRESMGTGSGSDEVYKPEWPFYNLMSTFLDGVYKPKKTKSSEESLDTEDIDEDKENTTQEKTEETFKIPKTFGKNKYKRSKLNECDEMKKRSDEAYNILKNISQKPDTCSLYCDLLCSKLRALQEDTRDIAMMEIDKIMYNLKQQDNHRRSFQYQNIIPSIGQQLYNYQTPTQVLPSYSPSSNSQPSPQHQISLPSPGHSHSSYSQSSPQHQVSLPSLVYSHSSNTQPSPQYQVSLASPVYSHSSNTQPSPQHQVSLPSPGHSHSSNTQPSPQHEVSLPSPVYSHSSNTQPSPQHEVSLPSPVYSHSSNTQPSPQHEVSLPSPGYSHSSHTNIQDSELKKYYESNIFSLL